MIAGKLQAGGRLVASLVAYRHRDRERHLLEYFANRLEHLRRLATRYYKAPSASKPSSSRSPP